MSSNTYLVYEFLCTRCNTRFRWQHTCKVDGKHKRYRRDKFGEIDFPEIKTFRTKKPLPKTVEEIDGFLDSDDPMNYDPEKIHVDG